MRGARLLKPFISLHLGLLPFFSLLLGQLTGVDAQLDSCSTEGGNYDFSLALDPQFFLAWRVDEAAQLLHAKVVANGTGWVGFGFSATTSPTSLGADAIVGYMATDGGADISYYAINSHRTIVRRPEALQADLTGTSIVRQGTTTAVTFTRPLLDSSGRGGVNITGNSTLVVLYAWGATDELADHGLGQRGAYELDFFEPRCAEVQAPTPAPVELALYGLDSDDPNYDWYVGIGFGTFHWRILAAEGMLSVKVIQPALFWVGWGVATSTAGAMTNADAVVAMPNGGVAAYDMFGDSADQVFRRNGKTATAAVTEASVSQYFGSTTVRFQRPLNNSGGGIAIDPQGINTFIWAVGTSSAFDAGHGTTRRGAVSLDFGAAPRVPASSVDSSCVDSLDPRFDYTHTLAGGECAMSWRRWAPIHGGGSDSSSNASVAIDVPASLSVEVRCGWVGGWIGWAVSSRQQMLGADAVLGVLGPDGGAAGGSVQQYDLVRKDLQGGKLLPREIQSLVKTELTVHAGTTTMSFTRPIGDTTGTGQDVSTRTWILFAWGVLGGSDGSEVQGHGPHDRRQIRLNLDTCESAQIPESTVNFAYAHAWLMGAAWVLAAPLGVAAARIGRRSVWWVGLHVALQVGGYATALGGVCLAAEFVQRIRGSGSHFKTPHGWCGLLVMCLGAIQMALGAGRPPAPKRRWDNLTKARWMWLYAHRSVAIALAITVIAQLFSGVDELSKLGQLDHRSAALGACGAAVAGVIALLVGAEVLREKRRGPVAAWNPKGDHNPQMSVAAYM